MGGDDAQIAQRESISKPGPVKGDQPWAGVEGGRKWGGGRGERSEPRGAASAGMKGREGGFSAGRELCGGVGSERGELQ